MTTKALILEDEKELSAFLQNFLNNKGFFVKAYDSAKEALKNNEHKWADIIILDLMLGEESGKEFLINIRKDGTQTPTIIVSAMGQIGNKIDLINCGADDFLIKPFNQDELLARLNAIIRRENKVKKEEKKGETQYGEFTINWNELSIQYRNKSSRLTKKEMAVLQSLLKRNKEVTSKNELISEVWGGNIGYHSNVIEATIKRLRSKIPSNKTKLIENIRGIGYKINLE